jgi:hypothetical protein
VYAQLSNASSVRYRQFLPDAIQPSALQNNLCGFGDADRAAGRGYQLRCTLADTLHSSALSLEDGKVIGVVDEDTPEEARSQDAIESLLAGILLDTGESEEKHAGQLERADLDILRWQRRKDLLRSIHTPPA